MKTLILKHNGHEAHVPYELPDSLRFDCFVPGSGMCMAYVGPRGDEVLVLEVHRPKKSSLGTDGAEMLPPEVCTHTAVLEQAGDVVRTFLEALPIEWSECKKAQGESDASWLKRLYLIESSWMTSTRPSDVAVLSTIAEMALLESDLHTAWCRLPEPMHTQTPEPEDDASAGFAARALNVFIEQVLVPRAQDLATAAAKRREAEWREQELERQRDEHNGHWVDLAIDIAKEGA